MKKKIAFSATLKSLEYRLRAFKDALPEHLGDIIQNNEDVIIASIREDQLYDRGVNGDNIEIASYMPYRPSTLAYKAKRGQPTSRVTLRDKGELYNKMHIVITKEGFYVTSKSKITPILLSKYGPKVLKLTRENLNSLIQKHIKEELVKRLKNAIKE